MITRDIWRNFPSLNTAFLVAWPLQLGKTAPAGVICSSHPQAACPQLGTGHEAEQHMGAPGRAWSLSGLRASPAHPQPLFAPKYQVWIHALICSGYILLWLCLLLLSSLLPFALFLPPNPCLVQAGHQFKEQLLFCNRSLARTLWELEHLLSGFSSIHFVSGLGNWHKSTLGLEQEEAGCYSGT